MTGTNEELDNFTQYPKPTYIESDNDALRLAEEFVAATNTVQLTIDPTEFYQSLEQVKEVFDRVKLVNRIKELETDITKLQRAYNRLERSNNGIAAELDNVRSKFETQRRKAAQAIAIIANAETYVAEHKKLDREELAIILTKVIE
jgi:DNA gyrase/topoisomerase IV subunit A